MRLIVTGGGCGFGPVAVWRAVCAADAVNTSVLAGFDWIVHAIPGATLVVSPTPSLAIHGKSFGPQEALLLVGYADRASPMSRTPAAHTARQTATHAVRESRRNWA